MDGAGGAGGALPAVLVTDLCVCAPGGMSTAVAEDATVKRFARLMAQLPWQTYLNWAYLLLRLMLFEPTFSRRSLLDREART